MNKVDTLILTINDVICRNIDSFDNSERWLMSQNILGQLRNFVEHISLKIFSNNTDIEISYENICKALEFIKVRGELKFLHKFHKLLQISASHYTLDWENSERLMLKYYEYLLRIKLLLRKKYGLEVLQNLERFPINTDSTLYEYYEKIAEKVEKGAQIKSTTYDRYYIKKIKPFFVNQDIFYEITLSIANDYASKFDRIIAFTRLDICENYAVRLGITSDSIEILGKEMPIKIITSWETSIRPCELNKFADIFWNHPKLSYSMEVVELMWFMTNTGLNLVDIINFSENQYQIVKTSIISKAKVSHFYDILDKVRNITLNSKPGGVILRYLLYRMNNKIIKQQFYYEECALLSNLYLSYSCIPFDEMPFDTSLINHNPKLLDLFASVSIKDREHELFARLIKNNTESNGHLFTSISEVENFNEDIPDLIRLYNSKLYYKHKKHRSLELNSGIIHIRWYVQDTIMIIQKFIELSWSGISGYSNSLDSWLQTSNYSIDSDEKKNALRVMFENSRVALIYGSAWTWKSTLINHISHFFKDQKKLFLANTNPAIDNLERKIDTWNSKFQTITKFLSSRNTDVKYDILIVDESSTVNNTDMLSVINKAKEYKLLVFVGDTYQIESIRFGNWFDMARYFIPKTSITELTNPYRSTNKKLLELWSKVRNIDESIVEHLTKNNYSYRLDDTIFERSIEDEIFLCLNYDWLYGINNLNKFLQSNNSDTLFQWWLQTYKVGDPILFNENNRFSPLIYNNMKWIIRGIQLDDNCIYFDIEIDKALNEMNVDGYEFWIVWSNPGNGNSIIRFSVSKYPDTDEDNDSWDSVVPFQVAYAISIHKAQWLEYESVKIVITNEVDEMITHNIFYTAITRAKENLKIYWTPETEKKVLENIAIKDNGKDFNLLKKEMKDMLHL